MHACVSCLHVLISALCQLVQYKPIEYIIPITLTRPLQGNDGRDGLNGTRGIPGEPGAPGRNVCVFTVL